MLVIAQNYRVETGLLMTNQGNGVISDREISPQKECYLFRFPINVFMRVPF